MTLFDVDINDLRSNQGIKWNRYPRDVIPTWVADMDFRIAAPIQEYLQSLSHTGNLRYTKAAPGSAVCEAFAERMQNRYGWSPDPAEMDCMADIVQGINIAVNVLCAPDEQVILHTPLYHPILTACHTFKRQILYNPLIRGESQWELDFDRLEAEITPRTRLLMLVNPHNPSGRVFDRAELERMAEVVIRHDLYVVADEIHCDLLFDNAPDFVPFASIDPEITRRTVTFNSATKSYNLGGVRCSVAHYGSAELRRRFEQFPAGLRGGANAIGAGATVTAWKHCDDWLNALIPYLQDNRDYLVNFLAQRLPDIIHIPNQSTFLAWLDCNALELEEEAYDFFLREARVGFNAGPDFGPEGTGHVRLNFATSKAVLTEILERMEKAVARL